MAPAPTFGSAARPMDARQLGEALHRAQRRVQGTRVCRPEHGLLASVLLKVGRAAQAEEAGKRDFSDAGRFTSVSELQIAVAARAKDRKIRKG
ncbi:MAG: hypothetical protein WAN26_00785 [Steroidobacteraceae bacterium]